MKPISAPTATETMVQDPHAGIRQGYPAGVYKILGAIQISIGAASIILNVVSIIWFNGLAYFIGYGIWCALFFILAGSFGVAAGSKRTGLIVSYLVLSITAGVIFVWPLIYLGVVDLQLSQIQGSRIISGIMLELGVLEGITAIISSAICCAQLCCPAVRKI